MLSVIMLLNTSKTINLSENFLFSDLLIWMK